MNYSQPYIIFSAERAELGARANFHRTEELTQTLQDLEISYKETLNQYQGTQEASVLVAWTPDTEQAVQSLCRNFGQECYLLVDTNRRGSLRKPDGSLMVELGESTTSITQPLDNYTRVDGTFLTFRGI